MSSAASLLARYPIISDQMRPDELRDVLLALERQLAKGERGAVVEFGCYSGTTSLFIRRLIDQYGLGNEFHVYDSFEGLPAKTKADYSVAGEQFKAGELAASKKQFLMNFTKTHLAPPVMHKGWFSDLTPADIPPGICFAFLDGDYYESIRDSFCLITPQLAPHAIIVVDDYQNEALPGAARAADEWCRVHRWRIQAMHSLALITPNT